MSRFVAPMAQAYSSKGAFRRVSDCSRSRLAVPHTEPTRGYRYFA